MKRLTKKFDEMAFTLAELVIVLGLYLTLPLTWLFVGGLWTQDNLSFWLSMAKHAPVHAPYWLGVLCNLFAPLAFLFDLGSAIARLIIS